jgi:Fe-S-cluster containining protein
MIKKDGFKFSFDESECTRCDGNCCVGESGYIWVTPNEIQNISLSLHLEVSEFKKHYLDKIKYRFSIKEKRLSDSNYACIFFDLDLKKCSIYDVRPMQCRTFPFWDYFRQNPQEAIKECPAIKY